ncbi:MAG: hypothetical protein BZY82_03505 [SAR202 cluster bacterium Io17-Chloro-G3]|nr:MAG: hypothetical protein BZY82_03505 [SAR202 cluster bacterium Io17-Chloro-G3]
MLVPSGLIQRPNDPVAVVQARLVGVALSRQKNSIERILQYQPVRFFGGNIWFVELVHPAEIKLEGNGVRFPIVGE